MKTRLLALTGLLSITISAHATGLSSAAGYNAVVFGDYHNTSWTDIEGSLAVGGNLNPGYNSSSVSGLSGYTVNGKSTTSAAYGLVVAGNANLNSSSVTGNVFVGGDFDYNNPTIYGNVQTNGNLTITNPGSVSGSLTYGKSYTAPTWFKSGTQGTAPLPYDFASAHTNLSNLSDSLAVATNTATLTNYYNTFTWNATSSGLNVATISTADLAKSTSFTINVGSSASAVVLNIVGSSASWSNGLTINGDATKVIYNFTDASAVQFSNMAVWGSVLAPDSAVTLNGGQIDGQLIADSYTGSGQINTYNFTGNLPAATPEPGTILFGLGLAGMAIRKRIKK